MNKFGEFLYQLRKEKNLTQTELAKMLGITNKAVSKWETGEAMPETSLLVPIAEIFGVTVDELLNGSRTQTTPNAELAEQNASAKNGNCETLSQKICGVVCATLVLGGIAAYLLLGAVKGLWTPYWVIIPVCALGCGIIGIVFNLCDARIRKREADKGKNPYTDAFCGICIILSIIVYLLLGALFNLWHPYWIIIVIAIGVGGITAAIGNCTVSKNKTNQSN